MILDRTISLLADSSKFLFQLLNLKESIFYTPQKQLSHLRIPLDTEASPHIQVLKELQNLVFELLNNSSQLAYIDQ